jgi:hypothetical protein
MDINFGYLSNTVSLLVLLMTQHREPIGEIFPLQPVCDGLYEAALPRITRLRYLSSYRMAKL